MSTLNETDRGYFRAAGYSGVAFHIVGYPRKWDPYTALETDPETGAEVEVETSDGEWYEDRDSGRVLARMVGDDHNFEMDRSDLTPLKRSEFCGGCGQIGCGCDPYDGDD